MNIREWTLPVYTILMQIAIGALLALWIVRSTNKGKIDPEILDRISRYPVLVVFITVLTAMIGAHLHLSQPLLSVLSLLNFRTAWLSREIAFTILFFMLTAGLLDQIWYIPKHPALKNILGWTTVLVGCLTVYIMGSVYLIRTQPVWETQATIVAFYGSTILLGSTALPLLLMLDLKFSEVRAPEYLDIRKKVLRDSLVWVTIVAVATAGVIFTCNIINIAHLQAGEIAAQTGFMLLVSLYRPLLLARIFTAFLGLGILIGTTILVLRRGKNVSELVAPIFLSFMLITVGEVLGRILFYATSVRIGL